MGLPIDLSSLGSVHRETVVCRFSFLCSLFFPSFRKRTLLRRDDEKETDRHHKVNCDCAGVPSGSACLTHKIDGIGRRAVLVIMRFSLTERHGVYTIDDVYVLLSVSVLNDTYNAKNAFRRNANQDESQGSGGEWYTSLFLSLCSVTASTFFVNSVSLLKTKSDGSVEVGLRRLHQR